VDLNISNRQIGDVSVVALRGRIVLGEGSSALRERVKNLVMLKAQRQGAEYSDYRI